MIRNICLLLEVLSVVFCLHYLYGEKVRLEIKTVSFLAIHMIIITTINYYNLSQAYSWIAYPIMAAYCVIRFGFKLKPLIVNYILNMVIVSSIQFIVLIFCYTFFKIPRFSNVRLLVVNCIAFIVIWLILPRWKLDKVSIYLQDKERIYIIALCICVVTIAYFLMRYKNADSFGVFQNILLFVSIVFICILVFQLGTSRGKAKEIEKDLKMHKLYADSFQNLIDNIRMHQHEFDNHISTMKGYLYTCDTLEEVVRAQEEYYDTIKEENHFNKLLKSGNPVIMGFIYGKFTEIEKMGIDISYRINIQEFNIGMPIYRVIEILGNLIKNAVEALKGFEGEKKLFVLMVEYEGGFEIEVRNTSRYFSPDEIALFFKKGYSQKGENRGLGLYNVKNSCDEYSFIPTCICETIGNQNWVVFRILTNEEAAKRHVF